jgi:DHA1 family multidrug resistance protein-like MFS transporter
MKITRPPLKTSFPVSPGAASGALNIFLTPPVTGRRSPMSPNQFNFVTYRNLLGICCVVVFGCYLGTYMRLPVVPLYASSLGADAVQVGIINAAFLFMAGSLSLPLGIFADRLGVKFLISLGLLILSGTSFLLCLTTRPGQIVWLYLLSGVGLAAFGPTIMAFVANFSPPTHLGRAYGWYTTALYCGMSLGPAVGGFTAQGLGFPAVFLISGIAILLTFGIVVLFLPRARHVLVPRPPRTETVAAQARQIGRNRPLLGCWVGTLGGCFALGMFITFLPLHAHNQGLSYGQIGLMFATQGIINALSRIPFGHLSDRVGRRGNLVVAGLVGLSASIGSFGFATQPHHFILGAVALGASMGLAFTSIGALTAEAAPAELRGLAMGGYNSAIYLGMMLSSALMGPVIRLIGYKEAFLITALLNFLVIGLFHFLMRDFSPHPAGPGLK